MGIAETPGEYLVRDKGELNLLKIYRALTDTEKEQAVDIIKVLKVDKGGEVKLKKNHEKG